MGAPISLGAGVAEAFSGVPVPMVAVTDPMAAAGTADVCGGGGIVVTRRSTQDRDLTVPHPVQMVTTTVPLPSTASEIQENSKPHLLAMKKYIPTKTTWLLSKGFARLAALMNNLCKFIQSSLLAMATRLSANRLLAW